MSLRDGEGLILWERGLFDPNDGNSAELLWRLQWAFAEIRRRGGRVTITEAGRPVGVRSDMYVRNAWETASGRSTMWFQWGRYKRGETPSAIDPAKGLSKHATGLAVDLSSPTDNDMRIRNEVLALVGIVQTIPNIESWHYELLHLNVGRGYQASVDAAPFTPALEEDPMLMLLIGGAHYAALGLGVFRHFLPFDPVEKIKNLSRAADDWQNVSFGELPSLLITYGCDEHIWDVHKGEFCVVDPLKTGADQIKPGNAWTAEKAIRAQIAGLKVPAPDATPIVDAVKAALAESSDVNEMSIAIAVNDLADARQRERLA